MSSKHWLLDLGNTRLKMAPLRKSARGDVTALAHGDEEFEGALRAHFEAHDGDQAWLASVAPPDTTSHLRSLLQDLGIEVARDVDGRTHEPGEDRIGASCLDQQVDHG